MTGRARYGADYTFAGMLHGKVLAQSACPCANQFNQLRKGAQLPGVLGAITGADFPEPSTELVAIVGEYKVNARHLSFNAMARDKVLYDGHPVAAVAAISPHIAEEALAP